MSTYTATPKDIEHRWFIVDADGMVLGRLAAEIVRLGARRCTWCHAYPADGWPLTTDWPLRITYAVRRGRVFVINKLNPRWKGRQG